MARRKPPRPDPEKLVARIESYEETYYISQDRDHDVPVGDEAMIDIVARIERISPRHKQHVGEPLDITLTCARSYSDDEPTMASDKPALLVMNLSKRYRGFMAYLPSAAFWAIPGMIETGKVTHIDVRFARLDRGSGDLLSVYLIPASKVDEVEAV